MDQRRSDYEREKKKALQRVLFVSLAVNIALTIIKIIAGVFGDSKAMIADGIHSFSDVVTSVIVLIGVRIANQPPDEKHQYGHIRYEAVTSKLIAFILVLTGLGIMRSSYIAYVSGDVVVPKALALYLALISIITKELLFRYVYNTGKKYESLAVMSDAWDNRSDAISSVGAFIGIFLSRIGFLWGDLAAGVFAAMIIVRVGISIYFDSVDQLVDSSPEKEIMDKMHLLASEVEGVRKIGELKARYVGPNIHIDMAIEVDPEITVMRGHEKALAVERALREEFPQIAELMIHVDPEGYHRHGSAVHEIESGKNL